MEYTYYKNTSVTARPLELLTLMATTGLSVHEAANKLCISVHTANQHLSRIRSGLHVGSNCQAVYKAVSMGLIPIGEPNSDDVVIDANVDLNTINGAMRPLSVSKHKIRGFIESNYPAAFMHVNERGDIVVNVDSYYLPTALPGVKLEVSRQLSEGLAREFARPMRVVIADSYYDGQPFTWLSSDGHQVAAWNKSVDKINLIKCEYRLLAMAGSLSGAFMDAVHYAKSLAERMQAVCAVVAQDRYPAVVYVHGCEVKLSGKHLVDLDETMMALYRVLKVKRGKGNDDNAR